MPAIVQLKASDVDVGCPPVQGCVDDGFGICGAVQPLAFTAKVDGPWPGATVTALLYDGNRL